MADRAADIDHVWKLIEDIPIAMVVTHEGQGQNMRARPMALRPARDEGAIFFLTDADTPKAEEIRRNQSVCLALSDNKSQKYVSISGHAEMIDDRERVKKYWSVYDKAFWTDKNDPRIRGPPRHAGERRVLGRVGKGCHRGQIGRGDRLRPADGSSRRERKSRISSRRQARRLKLEVRESARGAARSNPAVDLISAGLDSPSPRAFVELRQQAGVDRDGDLPLFAWLEVDPIPPDEAQRECSRLLGPVR